MTTSDEQNGRKKPKTRRDKWRHAFALGKEYEEKVTEEDEKILDAFARAIVKRGMTAPALLWIISLKPLNLIGANILKSAEFIFKDLALEVFIRNRFMPTYEHGAFVKAMEKRKCVERLIELIEHHEAHYKELKQKGQSKKKSEKTS